MPNITINLTKEQAGGLGWLLTEQIKSLKKLQREELDAMQPIIDDYQSIVNTISEQLLRSEKL